MSEWVGGLGAPLVQWEVFLFFLRYDPRQKAFLLLRDFFSTSHQQERDDEPIL